MNRNLIFMWYKIIFIEISLLLSVNCFSQENDCLKDIFLQIDVKNRYPQIDDDFNIYLRSDDSTYTFKSGDSICIDCENPKPLSVFFYYENRVVSCPVILRCPYLNSMRIDYYKIEDCKTASKKEFRKLGFHGCNEKLVLYFDDPPYNEELVLIPTPYWFDKKLNADEMLYGVVRIFIGRDIYYGFDWKPIYRIIQK